MRKGNRKINVMGGGGGNVGMGRGWAMGETHTQARWAKQKLKVGKVRR